MGTILPLHLTTPSWPLPTSQPERRQCPTPTTRPCPTAIPRAQLDFWPSVCKRGNTCANISKPLQEAHHFDSALGGISGLFENLRANTQAQSNLYTETSKSLTGSVLPILERLHQEIKNKAKELQHGAGK